LFFSDLIRTDEQPKRQNESNYDFLNRSPWESMEKIRGFLEDCISNYPKSEVDDQIARIKSRNEVDFKSATFELLLYNFLSLMSYKLEPHPKLLNGKSTKPDFLVTTPEGHEFYLEAVLASEINDKNKGAQALKSTVLDMFNCVSHKDFMIGINHRGDPKSAPRGKVFVSNVLNWLDSFTGDEMRCLLESKGLDALPKCSWNLNGWEVEVTALPLSADKRGKNNYLIGFLSGGAGYVNSWQGIRDALKYKDSKYGDIDKPLIVAVSFQRFFLDPIDEIQALYGQEQVVSVRDHPEIKPQIQHIPNGAWYGHSGPQGKRISAAWFFRDLSPYTAAACKQSLYVNPWANYCIPDGLKSFPHVELVDSIVQRNEGLSLGDIFELPNGWPE
jgi:hypothetical protein